MIWFLCGQENEKDLVDCSLYAFFVFLLFGRKEMVGCLKMRGGQFKGSDSPLFVIFGCGASCI